MGGVKTEYLTAGGRVLSEKKGGMWQHYLYDAGGQLHANRYQGADYYYVRDGLMNIVGLVDVNGTTVVSYQYDSRGVLFGISGSMAETLGKDNPYRYKGYYYDADDVSLLAASPMALHDKNLYAYRETIYKIPGRRLFNNNIHGIWYVGV